MSTDIEKLIATLGAKPDPNDPSGEQLLSLKDGSQQGPFHFVNLLRFREKAQYPEGHELQQENLSGSEAYDKYGAVAFQQVTARGGRLITLNNVEKQLIGSDQTWHRVATMEYQHIDAFIEMLLDPEYRAALPHREAGLEATELFVTRPVISEPLS